METSNWKSSGESVPRMAVERRKQPRVPISDDGFPATANVCIT